MEDPRAASRRLIPHWRGDSTLQAQEAAIDGIAPYEEGEGSAEEEATNKEAARAAAIETKANAVAAFLTEKRRLLVAHRDARRAVDEWRTSLGHAKERDRQNKQRGRLIAAIQEVQACVHSARGTTRQYQRRTSSITTR
jgi:hypothetical protein